MDKTTLNVHELEPGKMYDMVNNPHPNYLLYHIDEEGMLYQWDTVVKTGGKSLLRYNDVIKREFYEV